MMDRLIHTAHKLELKGGSMREYLAKNKNIWPLMLQYIKNTF